MTMFKIISLLTGYVTIIISGSAPERFINMASSRGIWLWDLKWITQDTIKASVRLSGIRPLRHIARETRCRFSIDGRFGLPFLAAKMRRRKTLVFGAVLFVLLLYMLSSFIWFVDVTGNERVADAEILKVARRAGLSRGTCKWILQPAQVEKEIQEQLPEVSWVGVHIRGARAVVEVVEKKLPPREAYEDPAHIVAEKDGVIKELLVLQGHSLVEEGQTVKQGDILISGIIPPPETTIESEEGEMQRELEPQFVHARGIARARVWYEGYGEVQLLEEGSRPTGRKISRVCIKIGDKEIILMGPRKVPYQKYQRQVNTKRLPVWRNIKIPVEIITEKYAELVDYRLRRSYEEARKLAVEQAVADARREIPKDAEIVSRQVKEVKASREKNIVRMEVLVEAIEEIGREKPFQP